MVTTDFETLRARVQALGYRLVIDSDGSQFVIDENPKESSSVEVVFIHQDDEDDNLAEWLDGQETAARDRQVVRGLVPAPGTKDGENGHYYEPSRRERREAIVKIGDTSGALIEAQGALHAIHGMGRLLQQDTLRDDDGWVLSIAHMIVEESDRMIEFLDRPGGWQGGAQ